MTDITTTATVTGFEGLTLPRTAVIGELARTEQATRAALARVAELETEIEQARAEQITDGSDDRLVDFWEHAGEIADDHDMCEEYDRMVSAVDGITREREYDVAIDLTINVTVYRSVTAHDSDSAVRAAEDDLDRSDIADALDGTSWDDIEFTDSSAELN